MYIFVLSNFILSKLAKKDVRKGMVMISTKMRPFSSLQFDAEILILHHPTTIACNYQAMGMSIFNFFEFLSKKYRFAKEEIAEKGFS